MGFSVMFQGAKKLVPAEYWCPYGIITYYICTLWLTLHCIQISYIITVYFMQFTFHFSAV